jgi:hypothetical protein
MRYFELAHERIACNLRAKFFEIMVCAENQPHKRLCSFRLYDVRLALVTKPDTEQRARERAARFDIQEMKPLAQMDCAAVTSVFESVNRFPFGKTQESRCGCEIKRSARADKDFHCVFECRRLITLRQRRERVDNLALKTKSKAAAPLGSGSRRPRGAQTRIFSN